MKIYLLLFWLSIGLTHAQNNIPMGTWRDHLPFPYKNKTIASNQDQILIASEEGGFVYRFADGSMEPLTRVYGLSETGITAIKYDATGQIAVIAYKSGMIDFIKNNQIIPMDAIVRSNITGSKRINHISIVNREAFLSADFGVVVLNLDRLEVKETWRNLKTGGAANVVYASCLTTDRDSVFLATEDGILAAKYNPGVNLMDFTNWELHGATQNLPSILPVRVIGSFNGIVYTAFKNDDIYWWNGTTWNGMGAAFFDNWDMQNMVTTSNDLLLCCGFRIYSITSPTSFTFKDNLYWTNARDVTRDKKGLLWFADLDKGLVHLDAANGLYNYSPNGPFSILNFKLEYFQNTIVVASGGYNGSFDRNWNYTGMYAFNNQESWTNYFWADGYVGDNVCMAYHPGKDSIYIGTWGNGLVTWKKGAGYTLKTAANSWLKTDYVGGLAVDKNNVTWIGASKGGLGEPSVFAIKGNLVYSYVMSQNQGRFIIDLKIDQTQYLNKWMRFGNAGVPKGVMVFNENGNQQRYFSSSQGVPGNVVTCLEIDRKGDIWIGTDAGIAGFTDPTKAFSSGSFFTPYYNGFPILFDKQITCIKSDGGNRKWVGTTDGLWLFNDDLSELILFYNMDNSPLPSNNIMDIAIHDITGEVFIGTDKGMMGYRSNANVEEEELSTVKVFPNPVRPGFNGLVTVEGLQDNCVVKFTNIQGHLVYETRANGGIATWNLQTYRGEKPVPGVYLIFVSTEDGKEGVVGKVAIVE
ncbi:MAG: two-component regulator propeller domain-containing protein [Cytophagaceae bacterium]